MLVFQAEHNILMHPFHMLGVAGVFGGVFDVKVYDKSYFFLRDHTRVDWGVFVCEM
jgi:hypothetical protein